VSHANASARALGLLPGQPLREGLLRLLQG
jgi:hypothetical protein